MWQGLVRRAGEQKIIKRNEERRSRGYMETSHSTERKEDSQAPGRGFSNNSTRGSREEPARMCFPQCLHQMFLLTFSYGKFQTYESREHDY